MTVAKKMQQTLANLQSAKADLKSFALETEDPKIQNMFSQFEKSLDDVVNGLQGRMEQIVAQEPQYDISLETRNKLS
ncbi:MAG: DUF1657 domain-containing protein [Candidatus Saccharibacteria bacterium]